VKVVINNTTGSITVRKDGATSDTWSATGVNTRGGTASNYANKVGVVSGSGSAVSSYFNDLLFYSGSGAAPNTWIGDVRALQLLPNADTAQRDFSRSTGSTN
jgi:hypothetical protein